MTTTIEKPQVLNLEDFLAQPETKPASEYFNGKVTQKPMPKGKHSVLQVELASAINQQAKPNKLAYALTELRCTFAGRSLVPDIAVIRWENLPRDEDGEISDRFNRHPDWVIEILSQDQPMTLVMEKILFCLQHGTELGWLIDPQTKSITLFQSNSLPKIYLAANSDMEPLTMLAGLDEYHLSVQDIFTWLKV
jgi:Uma2 family endonuclease